MNLSKGRIGEDNSALLGAMMITKIQLAAMSRVDVPEKERRDFYLYIDEFQNFSTDSFANILSEARKYRLNLILAHQYIEQLSEKVKPAVFGNVGTMVIFRVGAADAEELVKELTPTFTEEDIVNLPKYEMYMKLMIDGIASSPFSAQGLPPLKEEEKTGNTEKVIEYSREKYASNREMVEEKIMRWHESYIEETGAQTGAKGAKPFRPAGAASLAPAPAYAPVQNGSPSRPAFNQSASPASPAPVNDSVAPGAYQKNINASRTTASQNAPRSVASDNRYAKPGYSTICSGCGQPTTTVFEPDGVRPVYCRECLSKKKEEKRLEVEKRRLAKEEEKNRLERVVPKIPDGPALSLSALKQAAPVDFRGRPIKTAPLKNFQDKESETVAVNSYRNDEEKAVADRLDAAFASAPSFSSPQSPSSSSSSIPVSAAPVSSLEKEFSEGEEITITNNNF